MRPDKGSALVTVGLMMVCVASRVPAATHYVDINHPKASKDNPGTKEAPFKHIQQALDNVQPGDTVLIREGVYREHAQLKTPGRPDARITVAAAPGATVVLKGSVVVTGWERTTAKEIGLAGEYGKANIWLKRDWEKKNVMPKDEPGGNHWRTYVFHDRPRLAFWKDAVLEGAGRLGPAFFRHEFEQGRLFHDRSTKRLYIWLPPGVDPNENGIEVCLRPWLLNVDNSPRKEGKPYTGGDYVTVRGLQFRHAGTRNYTTTGAVQMHYATNMALEDCVISWNDSSGLVVNGKNHQVRNCTVAYNATGGLVGGGEGHLLEDNSVIGNNVDNYTYFNNAGGGKWTNLRNTTFRRHRAVRNNGSGLWLDIECNDNLFEGCEFSFNHGAGLDIEISRRNLVRNCIFAYNLARPSGFAISHAGKWENQRQYERGGGGWGLTNRDSEATRVYHCLFYGNQEGGLMMGAGGRTFSWWNPKTRKTETVKTVTKDLVVMNNIFAKNGQWQLTFVDPTKQPFATGCRCDYNLFFGVSAVNGFPNPLTQWQKETGFDTHSVYAAPDIPFPMAGQYAPPSTSAAVDAGMFVEECDTDLNGVKRPVGVGVDIGPYERAGAIGAEHRPEIPRALSFTPIDLSRFEKLQWKDVPNTGYVPLSAWPADERGRFENPAEVAKRSLGSFVELLPKDKDGQPGAGTVKLCGVPFEIGHPNRLLAIPPSRQGYVEIAINQKLDWLFVLHAGADVRDNWQAAFYRIHYSDDSMNISFRGGHNCSDYAAEEPEAFFKKERGTRSMVAWQGQCEAVRSGKLSVMCWAWPNHRPDVEITKISIWRQPYGSQWAVLGMTAGKKKE